MAASNSLQVRWASRSAILRSSVWTVLRRLGEVGIDRFSQILHLLFVLPQPVTVLLQDQVEELGPHLVEV